MKYLQKFFLIFLIIKISTVQVIAQNNGTISGQIRSKTENLEFATITLAKMPDSTKFIAFTTSDSLGRFSFKNLLPNTYKISSNLVGFTSQSKTVNLDGSLNQVSFLLIENVNQLQAVQVQAQKNLVEKTQEGFVLNAAANITQIGGSASDLLKNVPTLIVDAEGGISLRGKTPLILINGRISSLANPDLIAANAIERIEIINNSSAKYDANAESGIINIILKKNKDNGLNGALAAGAGFGAKARYSGSAQLNYKTNLVNIGLAFDDRYSGRTRAIAGGRTNFNQDQFYQLIQTRSDGRVERNQNLKLNLDFTPNKNNTLSLELIGNTEGQDNLETLFTKINNKSNSFVSNNKRFSREIARSKVGEIAVDYTKKFTDPRKLLTINFSDSKNFDKENTDIDTRKITENGTYEIMPVLERTHNYEDGQIINSKLDYIFKPNVHASFETGYKLIYRNIVADYEAGIFQNANFLVSSEASNVFNFKEYVHAGYLMYKSIIGSGKESPWHYTVGLRAENVHNDGYTKGRAISNTNDYLKWFPNATLSYQKSENQSFLVSYGKRINRPGLGQLNPFTDITDALNPHSGNPKLKPEIIHAFEIGMQSEFGTNSYNANLFYRHANNTIRPFYQSLGNGVNLIIPLNIGSSDTYGLENILSLKPSAKYDINASVTVYQQHLNGSNITADLVQNAFAWNGKLMQNFLILKNAKLQIVGNYNSDILTPQGKRNKQYYVDAGFQQKLGKGNARLSFSVIDIFNTLKSGYSNTGADFSNFRVSKADTRALMLTFAYTFKTAFKEKLLDNQFSKEY